MRVAVILFKLDNMKIQTKLFVFTAIIICLIVVVAVFTLYNEYIDKQNQLELIEQTIYKNYDTNIKGQVDNVVSLLDGVYGKYESGKITLEESKKLAADLVRNLKYNVDGYFWIDTIDGLNVVLLGTKTEGTNRYNFRDVRGVPVVKNFLDLALEHGEGYQNYWFPKANQTEPLMKRGYVKLYKPLNWVVGTGNYIDDIQKLITDKREELNSNFRNKVIAISVIFTFVVICTIALVFLIARNITMPLKKTIDLANMISNGIMDIEIDSKYKERKDEVGKLVSSIEKMRYDIVELIDKLTENASMLELEKELFSTTLRSIGDGVISTDVRGNVELMNAVAENLTGWSIAEAKNQPLQSVFNIINERTRKSRDNPVERVFEVGGNVELEDQTLLIKKNNEEVPIEDSAAPIRDEKGNITGVVVVFRDCTEKKEKQEKIKYLSYHDQLTGLYNRHFFEEALKRLDTDRNLPFTIAMIDVNGLKLTNDAFGHEVGDLLLKSVGKVLKNECRTDDIVSRVGGDEFVILLPKTSHDEAELIVKRIYKAVDSQEIDNVIVSVSIGWETKVNLHQDIKEVFSKSEDYMYHKKITESQSMRNQTIKVIMQTLHETNSRERVHSERVSILSRKIGEAMKLGDEILKELEVAGLMHDIGKIAINNNILNKPGKLTESEYEEIKKHPEISYQILKSADVYTNLAECVLSHHERWDGKGYPRGLSGEEIPLVARIITVADAYEAMTSDRSYRKGMTHEETVEEIIRHSGTQFDASIVQILIELIQ
jgi:diguanylate cyclase (GGDEF)-like protein/PAS domain S-box-containing protein